MDKVYCKFCKYLDCNKNGYYNCLHKNNRGDWRSPNPISNEPQLLNCHNDCKWFEEKPRKSPFENLLDSDQSKDIKITVSLDGKEISKYIYNQSEMGKKIIHERGIRKF